jgi:hypothetical protein
MKRWMNLLILSCMRATFFIEKSHAGPLSFINRLQLKMHVAICDKCSAYQKQSLFIEQVLRSHIKPFPNPKQMTLSKPAKEAIQTKIEQSLKKDN